MGDGVQVPGQGDTSRVSVTHLFVGGHTVRRSMNKLPLCQSIDLGGTNDNPSDASATPGPAAAAVTAASGATQGPRVAAL